MRLPGFTAENALGRAANSYRAGAGRAAGQGQGVRPAVIGGGARGCRDCDGSVFYCPPGTWCNRLCTASGGFAYCESIDKVY